MFTNKKFAYIFFILVSLVALSLVCPKISQSQNWFAMPPYNTLWPLWSPALSPIDSISGLPVPIVSELISSTVLPVQPGLTWDPSAADPWLLYNTPLGMAYYEPIGGVNMWPPSYLQDTSGSPLPLLLPPDYGYLPPTSNSWLSANIPLGNTAAFNYLKTLGLPIFTPPVFGPILPPTYGGLFQAPSAYFPVAPFPYSLPAPILPLPIPTALLPIPTALLPIPSALLPIPSALLPPPSALLPVPTVLLPAPSALAPLPVPTIVAPSALAPLPVPSVVAPSALAPLPVPSVVAPTALVPSALIL